jgi:hypothetical protein
MEKSEKEYGRLSLDQFKQLAQKLPEIRKKLKEPPKLLRSIPEDEKHEVLGEGLSWANVYERSLNEQLALLFDKSGRSGKLREATQSDDPTQTAFDLFGDDDFVNFNGSEGGAPQKRYVIGLLIALKRSILSVMLFDRTLDKMAEEVRFGKD